MTPDLTARMLLVDMALPPVAIPENIPRRTLRGVAELLATRCPYRIFQAVGLVDKHCAGYAKLWGANLDENTLVLLEQCAMQDHLEITNSFLAMRTQSTRLAMRTLYENCELCQAALRALVALRPNGAGEHLAISVNRIAGALAATLA